jgi:hypothetical protein
MAQDITMTNRHSAGIFLLALALASGAIPGTAPIAAGQTATSAAAATAATFATADEAVVALIAALRSRDDKALRAVLGAGSEKLISSGDRVADAQARQNFLAAYDAKHAVVPGPAGSMLLQVGEHDWPVPLPMVQTKGRWRFDSRLGAQQLVDRRIGENEIDAIRTSLAYVDAQKLYFTMTGDYAQRIVSTPGQHDGLYWPAEPGQPQSPLAPLVAEAEEEGYTGERAGGAQALYQGYNFRILKAQGPNAASGMGDYVVNGHMTKGFALVGWPATYGASGIMTFVVNQDGIVFQKDLGPRTAATASAMTRFDPDLSWVRVDVVD